MRQNKTIFIDGCFDIFHYGHANAIRQAKLFGSKLIVAVNTSETISKHKNKPVMTDLERNNVVSSLKWADEVISCPYMLDYNIINKNKVDLIVHGDDEIVDAEGNDCYLKAKEDGKFVRFERTHGISTSEVVGRMIYREKRKKRVSTDIFKYHNELVKLFHEKKDYNGGKIVYIDGTFDLFHAGHASIIEAAKKRGDYLIVGLHSDNEVYKFKGEEPIMRTIERKLCLLANKFVDVIIDDAPFVPTQDFVKKYNINEIVCGIDIMGDYKHLQNLVNIFGFKNEFYYLNVKSIVERIIDNYDQYLKKVEKLKGK